MANTNVTINKANVSLLPIPERTGGFTHRFRVSYTDVALGSGSSDTVTLTLGTTPANWFINKAMVYVSTAFAGTTAFTVVVGTSTSAAAILASTSVLSAGVIQNTNGPSVVNHPSDCIGTAAINLVATFTNATGGSPSALSAGVLDIFLGYHDPSKIDGPYINN